MTVESQGRLIPCNYITFAFINFFLAFLVNLLFSVTIFAIIVNYYFGCLDSLVLVLNYCNTLRLCHLPLVFLVKTVTTILYLRFLLTFVGMCFYFFIFVL